MLRYAALLAAVVAVAWFSRPKPETPEWDIETLVCRHRESVYHIQDARDVIAPDSEYSLHSPIVFFWRHHGRHLHD